MNLYDGSMLGGTMKYFRIVSVLFILTSLCLCGCANGGIFTDKDGHDKNDDAYCESEEPIEIPIEYTPIPMPDGVTLTGFYMTNQGMERGLHYILKVMDTGTYMKMTDLAPDELWLYDPEADTEDVPPYFCYADKVSAYEYASLVLLEDDSLVQKLEEIIVQTGALGWDGYNEKLTVADVADSGDSYFMYIELSDGTTVTLDSYNCCPDGYTELQAQVKELFYENRDYSRYLSKGFFDAECTSLYVHFLNGYGEGEWKLELDGYHDQWIVVLFDPKGIYLEEGTDIQEYATIEESLPFERFLRIFEKYGAEEWNGYEESEDSSNGAFDIELYFDDMTKFEMYGDAAPEGFEDFRKELAEEMYRFYTECCE